MTHPHMGTTTCSPSNPEDIGVAGELFNHGGPVGNEVPAESTRTLCLSGTYCQGQKEFR